jgi:hypothetical protein
LKALPLAAAVALIVAVVTYFSLPASAESLYEEIMSVARDGETADLIKVESEIDQFLDRFPEHENTAEVRELREELDLYRLQRRYERRARLRKRREDLGPVEGVYVEATRLALSDPPAAADQLQAIIDVYGGAELSEDDQQCLELARDQLRLLRKRSRGLFDEELQAIERRLDDADAMAHEQPDRARAVRQGVVSLYRDKSWAQPAVERARAALSSHNGP